MRKRVITASIAGLVAVVLVGWIVAHFGIGDRSSPPVDAGTGSVQPLTPDEAAPGDGRGQKSRQRNDAGRDYPWISPDELKARLDRGEKVLVVNTRSSLSEPIIKGALEIPEDDIEAWSDKIPKSSAIVTYCS